MKKEYSGLKFIIKILDGDTLLNSPNTPLDLGEWDDQNG